jgi:hypothetical protein
MKEKLKFKKNNIVLQPIKYWEIDNNLIAIYQGYRGDNPDLDFIVKYCSKNKRLRQPSHLHWVVDLLLKTNTNKSQTLNLVNDLLFVYDETNKFENIENRDMYELKYYKIFKDKYSKFDVGEGYTISFIFSLIELFTICEKQTKGAFMFSKLLKEIKNYCEDKKDYYSIISLAKRV